MACRPTAPRARFRAGGQNPRYNTITIDGVSASDTFGLEGNNMPTRRQPVSMDAIEAIDIKLSNYDVSTPTRVRRERQRGDQVRHQRIPRFGTTAATATATGSATTRDGEPFTGVHTTTRPTASPSAARSSRTSCSSSPTTRRSEQAKTPGVDLERRLALGRAGMTSSHGRHRPEAQQHRRMARASTPAVLAGNGDTELEEYAAEAGLEHQRQPPRQPALQQADRRTSCASQGMTLSSVVV